MGASPGDHRAGDTRLQRLRWTETRDGGARVILAVLPVLAIVAVYLLLRPPPGAGVAAGGLILAMAVLVFLVRVTCLTRYSDPALAVPVTTATAIGLVALITALLVLTGEPAAAVALALTVLVAGVFILSVPAVAAVAVAAHAGFIGAAVHHGGGTPWVLAGAGLAVAALLAGLSHHRQVHVLQATLRLGDRENRHNAELEAAFKRARDAELNAKRLSESASAGLRAMREREALRARMQSILDSAGEGIVGTDHDGRIVFVNEAATRLTGYQEGQMIRENLHELVHHTREDGSIYPESECPVQKVFLERRVREVQGEVFWRRDGSPFPVSYIASPLIEEGKVGGAVVVFQDVTERAEIENMKDELVSVVSHELRTPLTSIQGSLQLLVGTMKGKLPKEAESLVEMATRNTTRLVKLVNELLDLERLRAGRFEMEPSPVGARALALEAAESLHAFAHGHRVQVQISGDDVTLVADGPRIVQALVNLISNAVKFSPEEGTVKVSVEHDETRVWFSVEDAGPGIPRDQQKRLFQKFSQLDPIDSRKRGGTGLGLAITRGIVEAHGGSVGLISEPGNGSTFYFMLPRQPVTDTGGDATPAPQGTGKGPAAAPSRAQSPVTDRP